MVKDRMKKAESREPDGRKGIFLPRIQDSTNTGPDQHGWGAGEGPAAKWRGGALVFCWRPDFQRASGADVQRVKPRWWTIVSHAGSTLSVARRGVRGGVRETGRRLFEAAGQAAACLNRGVSLLPCRVHIPPFNSLRNPLAWSARVCAGLEPVLVLIECDFRKTRINELLFQLCVRDIVFLNVTQRIFTALIRMLISGPMTAIFAKASRPSFTLPSKYFFGKM